MKIGRSMSNLDERLAQFIFDDRQKNCIVAYVFNRCFQSNRHKIKAHDDHMFIICCVQWVDQRDREPGKGAIKFLVIHQIIEKPTS